jgi:lysophospholipase L1-like esterase
MSPFVNLVTAAPPALTFTQGDVIKFVLDINYNVVTVTASNVTNPTSNNVLTFSYSTTYPISYIVPNASNVALWNFGGTYDVQSILVESSDYQYANLMLVGDSKFVGYSADNFSTSFYSQLQANKGGIVLDSGAGDTTTAVLAYIPEIIKFRPHRVLLGIGSNDKRSSVSYATWAANYDSIVSQLTTAGIDVWHLLPLNESVLTFTDYIAHINATYSSSKIINAGTVGLASDGVHPNQAGHNTIYAAIIASGIV